MFDIHLSDVQEMTLSEFCDLIRDGVTRELGVRLDRLTYWEMIVDRDNQPYSDANGIYWFSNERQIDYVGKSTSRSFVERIGGHYSAGTGHMMNTFLRHLYRSDLGSTETLPLVFPAALYERVATYRLGVFRILDRPKDHESVAQNLTDTAVNQVGVLETALRFHLHPRLNAAKTNIISGDAYLRDIIPAVLQRAKTRAI